MRAKSSSVLTIFSRRSALRCTVASASPSSASPALRASCTGPSMSVSGVLNSWLTLLKNAVFARSISASASARFRSSSYARAFASAVPN
jgi:hypothetical protein